MIFDRAGKTNLRLCADDVLYEMLGVTRGSLSYLALMNESTGDVKFAVDSDLTGDDGVLSHPLRCDRSVRVRGEDVIKYARHTGHAPMVLDYDIGAL